MKNALIFALITACGPPPKQTTGNDLGLPGFGVYTCRHCKHKDTVYFYWNLDTNGKLTQYKKANGLK